MSTVGPMARPEEHIDLDMLERVASQLKWWDRIWRMDQCPHCHGSGLAPSADGRTPCGFCES